VSNAGFRIEIRDVQPAGGGTPVLQDQGFSFIAMGIR
jgi:hypothetical protein